MKIIGRTHRENTAPISRFRASNDDRRSRLPFTVPQFQENSVARISFLASHYTVTEFCGDGDSSAVAATVFCPQEAAIDDATN
ncbi:MULTISPECIES: hypothetical protein [Rhizobium]|uniref:hypothetical protein n=1 Tax=Rhizobium TaxID=379 RepID=UPI001B325960|nr:MULTISPECIES: hypothetical protein [Rhizobium]MBX4908201.1 hypothetical protein [Rhizobium bangladeshense]MBX5217086.1 hypothetical protein [Rhizobium sp. NLR9a]MBX5222495.1 hypothetical protein [Rhizobium sp. NLR8a]MBX5227797.1 hypothetical protein [Rhizobium sp. NLR9b]MBX5233417.1 hypothetical protein [Rhizobium sp. NLR4a]